jgi:hypothetical protein
MPRMSERARTHAPGGSLKYACWQQYWCVGTIYETCQGTAAPGMVANGSAVHHRSASEPGGRFRPQNPPGREVPRRRRASGHAPGRDTARGGAGSVDTRWPAPPPNYWSQTTERVKHQGGRAGRGRAGPPSPAIARARQRAQLARLPSRRPGPPRSAHHRWRAAGWRRRCAACMHAPVLRFCMRCPSAIDE